MSLEKKLKIAATTAAVEACQVERGRVLWIMDDTIEKLKTDFAGKIMVEGQRELARIKLEQVEVLKMHLSKAYYGLIGVHVTKKEAEELRAILKEVEVSIGLVEDPE